jgi:hypothetical protein
MVSTGRPCQWIRSRAGGVEVCLGESRGGCQEPFAGNESGERLAYPISGMV